MLATAIIALVISLASLGVAVGAIRYARRSASAAERSAVAAERSVELEQVRREEDLHARASKLHLHSLGGTGVCGSHFDVTWVVHNTSSDEPFLDVLASVTPTGGVGHPDESHWSVIPPGAVSNVVSHQPWDPDTNGGPPLRLSLTYKDIDGNHWRRDESGRVSRI